MGKSGTELKNIKDELLVDIKSLLMASKAGLTEYELRRDYEYMLGRALPFTQLGFNSIYDMMMSWPNDVSVRRSGNVWVYYAIHDEKTRGLGRLVSGQLDKNKAVRERKREYESKRQSYRQPSGNYQRYQFQTYNSQHQTASPTQTATQPPATTNGVKRVTPNLEKEIAYVFELNGLEMSLAKFEREYYNYYGFRLSCLEYGFGHMVELFETLPNLFYVKYPPGTDSTHLEPNSSNMITIGLINKVDRTLIPVDQLVKELRDLVYSENSIELKRLPSTFQKRYDHSLDYRSYGYLSLSTFISIKLKNEIKLSFRDDINGYMVCSMENNSTEEVSKTPGEEIKRDENVKDCEDNEVDLNDLVAEIEKALVASGKSSNTELTVHDLIDSYRRYHKRELDLAKYKLISVDQLLCKLRTMGRVRINESDNTFSFFSAETSPEVTSRFSNLLRRPKTSLFSLKPEDNTQRTKYEKLVAISETLVQKGEILNASVFECMSQVETMRQLAANPTNKHSIIVSQVQDPSFIQFQLYENYYELESLMNQLEHAYYGIGSTMYDMPDQFKRNGLVCVAIFPNDKNWHRAYILQTFKKERRATVYFIDYGGQALIDYDNIKFMKREFTHLPIQALDAKFANVKFTRNPNQGTESVMNYLLNRVMNKTLEARITGVIGKNLFCLEIIDKCTHMSKAEINLNKRIIQDGFGTGCDDSKTPGFVDFETWKKQFLDNLNSPPSSNNTHQVSPQTSSDSNSPKTNNQSIESSPPSPNGSLSMSREYIANGPADSSINVNNESLSDPEDIPEIFFRQVKIDFPERESVLFTQIKINDKIYFHINDLAKVLGLRTSMIRHMCRMSGEDRYEMYVTRIQVNQVTKYSFHNIFNHLDLPLEDKIELLDQQYLLILIKPWFTYDTYEFYKTKFSNALKQSAYKPPQQPTVSA